MACSVFSVEAKTSDSARPSWREMCSSSHCRSYSIGTVIRFAGSARTWGQCRPKTAALILGSTATSGMPIAVPIAGLQALGP
ncbi:hypothetical protein BG452_07830 [Streptomyces sp. CBMA123]|nr:hypothetical protein [Streptomyces sp. CBMA123]